MKIFWSELAIERVAEIAEYIKRDNFKTAEKWIESIFKRVKQLESFPKSGRMVPELNRPNIREIFFEKYRIIYKIEANRLPILTVRHGRQLLLIDEVEE